MRVGILIPTFNRASFIVDSILSALNQSHRDTVVIVYDDGSTDRTVKRIEQLAEKVGSGRIILEKSVVNQGIPYARNALMGIARDHNIPVCAWQDSDDLSHPQRIERQLQVHRNDRITKCWYYELYPDGTTKGIASGVPASVMFATAAGVPFDTRYQLVNEDLQWRNAMKDAGIGTQDVRDHLYYYRMHAAQTTTMCRAAKVYGRQSNLTFSETMAASDRIWHGEAHYLFKNTPVLQNPWAYPAWAKYLTPDHTVFEIGTKFGGWAMQLSDLCRVYTCDTEKTITDEAFKAVMGGGGSFMNVSYEIAVRTMTHFDNLVVMCDGGNKIKEFNDVVPLLRKGQTIALHDYAESLKDFRERVDGKFWNWCEAHYAPIANRIETYGLTRVPGFEKTAWGVWRKDA